jgi:hypothetical protein
MPTKRKKPSKKKSGKTLWEIHGDNNRHGQQECTRCTQEISRHQKQRTRDDIETNKETQRGPQQTWKWNGTLYKERYKN